MACEQLKPARLVVLQPADDKLRLKQMKKSVRAVAGIRLGRVAPRQLCRRSVVVTVR